VSVSRAPQTLCRYLTTVPRTQGVDPGGQWVRPEQRHDVLLLGMPSKENVFEKDGKSPHVAMAHLVPGHTHNDVDALFGIITIKMRKMSPLSMPAYCRVLEGAFPNFRVRAMEIHDAPDMIYMLRHKDNLDEASREVIDPSNPPSTRDALLKDMFLDDDGNVRIRWKKYMSKSDPWEPSDAGTFCSLCITPVRPRMITTDACLITCRLVGIVMISAETEVPDLAGCPGIHPMPSFDLDDLHRKIARWKQDFGDSWTAQTESEWAYTVKWLTKLMTQGRCEECARLRHEILQTKTLLKSDIAGKERSAMNGRKRRLEKDAETHCATHAQLNNFRRCTVQKFRWPVKALAVKENKGMVRLHACVVSAFAE
jgi:hypothetical protein